ncbi:MAG TPA: nicotinate-nucleotide adenylyltransferase [Patescibacteria group bacterium]|nr:nicotinate-nucleotide adenylyltransferase [Patescibacteria group bacterium]
MSELREGNKTNRIGIMGGTFDPIHYGHLVAAEVARAEFGLDKVIFIPAGRPPHKQLQSITDAEHRYRMTILATSSNPNFEVSRIEVDKDELTYTIDTVKDMRRIYGEDAAIYFITGADAVLEFLTWYKLQELLTLCRFIAVTRPGFDKRDLEQMIGEIASKYNGEIICIEVPLLAISSTDIRERSRSGKPIKYLLPEAVEEYIEKNVLY